MSTDDPTRPVMPPAQWSRQKPADAPPPGPIPQAWQAQLAPTQLAPTQPALAQPAPTQSAPTQLPQGQTLQDSPPPVQVPPGPVPQAWPDQPPATWPAQPGPVAEPAGGFGRKRRRRRVRRSVMTVFILIVLAILLTISDRVANLVTENQMAAQFTANGFPVKPSVTIEGFPFLTQLAAKDFKKVDISASSIPAGPVTITSMHATLTGMHISGYSSSASATIDNISASAFISFGALAQAGGLGGGSGITVTPDGTNKLKIAASLGGIFSDTEEAEIRQTGPQTITVQVLNSGSALGSVLSSFGTFSFTLPQGVPASLHITGLTLNAQGLTVSAAATNATFSKSSASSLRSPRVGVPAVAATSNPEAVRASTAPDTGINDDEPQT
jgi:hypothetical protein